MAPQKFKNDDDALMLEAGSLVDKLGENWRKALTAGGSYEERAAKLGIQLGTVRSRLHRARAALRKMIAERNREAASAKQQADV